MDKKRQFDAKRRCFRTKKDKEGEADIHRDGGQVHGAEVSTLQWTYYTGTLHVFRLRHSQHRPPKRRVGIFLT